MASDLSSRSPGSARRVRIRGDRMIARVGFPRVPLWTNHGAILGGRKDAWPGRQHGIEERVQVEIVGQHGLRISSALRRLGRKGYIPASWTGAQVRHCIRVDGVIATGKHSTFARKIIGQCLQTTLQFLSSLGTLSLEEWRIPTRPLSSAKKH